MLITLKETQTFKMSLCVLINDDTNSTFNLKRLKPRLKRVENDAQK